MISYNLSYRASTPKEMADMYKKELIETPRWKFLKRRYLRRAIELWDVSDE